MKAEMIEISRLLENRIHFTIPIYQRKYSWNEKHCEKLWEDIIDVGKHKDDKKRHFIGSVVMVDEKSKASQPRRYSIIDGQQRLTTFSIILIALSKFLAANHKSQDGFSDKSILSNYIHNENDQGDFYYRFLPSDIDESAYKYIVTEEKQYVESKSCIADNFEYFVKKINSIEGKISVLIKGLMRLSIVHITLDSNQEEPQLIFESMNSTGLELSQADLIRNFILMNLSAEEQKKLYETFWKPLQDIFQENDNTSKFDSFIRHYLTFKTNEIPNINSIYESFKKHHRKFLEIFKFDKAETANELTGDLLKFAYYYRNIAFGAETETVISKALYNLRGLNVDVHYPLLLKVYGDWKNSVITRDEFEEVLIIIDSYIFRRAACGLHSTGQNKIFSGFGKSIVEENYVESVKAHFLLRRSGTHRFPSNDEFESEIKSRNLFNFRNRMYWLFRMENFERKECFDYAEYTIEHVMPQKLTGDWIDYLGSNGQDVHTKYLHTLGNLTLTAYNSKLGAKLFSDKKNVFSSSPLSLNSTFKKYELWGKESIEDRANILAKKALKVWPFPQLSPDALNKYRDEETSVDNTEHAIEDHKYLMEEGLIKNLFDLLDKKIMEIDSKNIIRRVMKTLISYRHQNRSSSFVCVLPQKRQIKLTLDSEPDDIYDPWGITRDVSQVGHYGTGDVEVTLDSEDILPKVMEFIHLAYDGQDS